jgi:hypothetical protein
MTAIAITAIVALTVFLALFLWLLYGLARLTLKDRP